MAVTTHADDSRSLPDARSLIGDLTRYRKPCHWRSLFELAVTLLPFVALWALEWAVMDVSYGLSLLLAIPASLFLVRLFMIQHDCGHGAFFKRKLANDWVGRVLSVITLTPYDYWRRTHAIHHATSGNLDRRGVGDIDTLTVTEYLALPWWKRLGYRAYRNPLVMFGIGPIYVFALQFRVPARLMSEGWWPWMSAMGTNLGIAAAVAALMWWLGAVDFLAVHVPVTMLATSMGVWLFFVQHQFEDTTWDSDDDWNVHDAALHGSSYYDLPGALRWVTANIGMHHIHHLCSRIPFYRLPEVLRDYPELKAVGRITLMESLKCVRLVLWDEAERELITFSDLRKTTPVPA